MNRENLTAMLSREIRTEGRLAIAGRFGRFLIGYNHPAKARAFTTGVSSGALRSLRAAAKTMMPGCTLS